MPPRAVAVAILLGSAGTSAAVVTPARCLAGKTQAQKQAEAESVEDAKAAAEEAQLRKLIQQTRAFTAHQDPASGRTYYVMRATLETTWENPEQGSLPSGAATIVDTAQQRLAEVLREHKQVLETRSAARAAQARAEAAAQASAELDADAAMARRVEHERREVARAHAARCARLNLPANATEARCIEEEIKLAQERADAEKDARAKAEAERIRRQLLRDRNQRRAQLGLPEDAPDELCDTVELERKIARDKKKEEERAMQAREAKQAEEARQREVERRKEELRLKRERAAREVHARKTKFEQGLEVSIASELKFYSPYYQEQLRRYAWSLYAEQPTQAMQILANQQTALALHLQKMRKEELEERAKPRPHPILSPLIGAATFVVANEFAGVETGMKMGALAGGVMGLWVLKSWFDCSFVAKDLTAAIEEEQIASMRKKQALAERKVMHRTKHRQRKSRTEVDTWVPLLDPSSGKTYYLNTKTRETSWAMPSA